MQAVIVDFACDDIRKTFPLSDELDRVISLKGLGTFDGNSFGEGDGTLFMYGPSADELFHHVMPVLDASPLMDGATVTVRYGPPGDGVEEKTFTIKSPRVTGRRGFGNGKA